METKTPETGFPSRVCNQPFRTRGKALEMMKEVKVPPSPPVATTTAPEPEKEVPSTNKVESDGKPGI